MQEKRREKRIPITIKLSVSDLYPEDVNTVIDMSSPIEVTDISAKGIGFLSGAVLPVGFIFIANIELDKSLPQIITDLRIIRSQALQNSLTESFTFLRRSLTSSTSNVSMMTMISSLPASRTEIPWRMLSISLKPLSRI